jgi:hypothetical protein
MSVSWTIEPVTIAAVAMSNVLLACIAVYCLRRISRLTRYGTEMLGRVLAEIKDPRKAEVPKRWSL